MDKKSGTVSFIIAIIIGCISIVTLPGVFRYWYKAGAGHAIHLVIRIEGVGLQWWDNLPEEEKVSYLNICKYEGIKCATFMVLGKHIPICLFVLITVGLLTRSISYRFRSFLRFSFFGVWVLGMLFLSFGVGYWGQAPKFPKSLRYVIFFYFVLLAFFGVILGIGKLIQRITTESEG